MMKSFTHILLLPAILIGSCTERIVDNKTNPDSSINEVKTFVADVIVGAIKDVNYDGADWNINVSTKDFQGGEVYVRGHYAAGWIEVSTYDEVFVQWYDNLIKIKDPEKYLTDNYTYKIVRY